MQSIFMKVSKNLSFTALLLYFIFFLLLFLQLPLKKQIPGNCDTWLALTYSSYTLETLKSHFEGENTFRPMYPVDNPLAYGESTPGTQALIIILKYIGLKDYWAYYLFICFIFALTAFSIFVFTGNFTNSFPAALFAGFIFTVNNMSFAHIDDPIIIFFFFPVISLHFLLKWFRKKERKFLVLSAVTAGLQIYFSFYLFFYQLVMILVFFVVFLFQNKELRVETVRSFLLFPIILGMIATPHVYFYFGTLHGLEFVELFESFYTVKMASLNPIDLLLVLPDNLIYPDLGKLLDIPMNWGFARHYNFTGFLALILFIYSMFKWNRHRLLFGLLAVTGIFLATGPVFMFNFKEVFFSPLYLFYKLIPILAFLRVAARAHFIFLFALSVGAALSAEKILSGKKHLHFFFAVFFMFHFLESTPFPLKGFDASLTDSVPMIYQAAKTIKNDAVIAVLPSRMDIEYLNWDDSVFNDPHRFIYKNSLNPKLKVDNISMFVHSWDDIFQYNREIIYTYWQTSHKLDSINGVNGYFPVSRMMYQYHISKIPEKSAFTTLRKWGVDYIIWHEFMKIEGDTQTLEMLLNSPCLKKIYAGEKSWLFKLEECDD